jgi:NhaA family Na+:H+ antiporter
VNEIKNTHPDNLLINKHKISNRSLLDQIVQPFQDFIHLESASGLILLVCTLLALVFANSSLCEHYTAFWQTEISIGIDTVIMKKTLLHLINDGLMCIFFFVVGLEIKRELLVGELASFRRAFLPMAAAFGGMIVPALIFAIFTRGTDSTAGWGIPMATDIAFSLGVLTLLGPRIPHQLKIFLAAFAIVDDLGAVLVIALFYGTQIHWLFLGGALFIYCILLSANWGGITRPSVYLFLGTLLWMAMLESGIHATIAGVLLATTIPSQSRINMNDFLSRMHLLLERFKPDASEIHTKEVRQEQQSFVQTIEIWVTFGIMPLFAFANAGVAFGSDWKAVLSTPVALGIVFGLVFGKQIGISFFSWIAVKSHIAVLPMSVSWKHIYGISWLGGIGFTMSLFIANLAFPNNPLLDISKIAVLAASSISGCIGLFILFLLTRNNNKNISEAERKD